MRPAGNKIPSGPYSQAREKSERSDDLVRRQTSDRGGNRRLHFIVPQRAPDRLQGLSTPWRSPDGGAGVSAPKKLTEGTVPLASHEKEFHLLRRQPGSAIVVFITIT
jgi:hypothetical protein